MCCEKGNKLLVTLRVFIIIVCVLHLVSGCFGLFGYAVSGEYSNILNVAAPILAIVIGIFGIVAASKRNLWLVGIFAVTMVILMCLYAASAALIAQNWDEQLALIKAQLQVAGLDTSSASFEPYRDSIVSVFVVSYSVVVTMAIVEALTCIASLLYFYIVKRQGASNSIA